MLVKEVKWLRERRRQMITTSLSQIPSDRR